MLQNGITWPKDVVEARRLQELDRHRVRIVPLEREPRFIAAVDAAFSGDSVFASACLYDYPGLRLIEETTAVRESVFPYLPGYLLFREGPAMIAALQKMKHVPDLILIDGQGIAHPRGIGSASHMGVLLGTPTIGCAKTRLIGEFTEPGLRRGDSSPLSYQGKQVGVVLRTKDSVKPLFISSGHKIDLDGAIRIILGCSGKYRIPEPLRCADLRARKLKKAVTSNLRL